MKLNYLLTQPRDSHKMITIVEDLLVELLELDDVREHVEIYFAGANLD